MRPGHRRWLKIGLAILLMALAVDATVLAIKWPFTRRSITEALRDEAGGEVTIREFSQTFFPQPGCIATGVVIHHGPSNGGPPLIALERLTIQGDYSALLTFRKRLAQIRANDMRIHIRRGPYEHEGQGKSSAGSITVGRLIAEHVVLEFESKKPGGEPYALQIHRTVLTPATATAAMAFEVALAIPEPPGEVTAKGSFGPWRAGDAFHTPVSGDYIFDHADLGKFKGIAGILGSTGKFSGTIAAIEVSGNVDVPDFELEGTKHRVHLATAYRAVVDGQTGDVRLPGTDSQFLHTSVEGQGAVAAPAAGGPKTVSLTMSVNGGRIQDLLRLVSSGPPGLVGVASARLKVQLPPGDARFLERLRISGDMGVEAAKFTKRETQAGLEHISGNAEGGEENPADVVSDLKGHVAASNGVATLTGVTFHVPGASAEVSGTYHLITHRLDLRGTVRLEEELSETTTGFKSFLLKALDPFFKKKKHLSVVPVRISGQEGHTAVTLDMGRHRQR